MNKKEILWDGKTEFWAYASGTIVSNIPRGHPIFDRVWEYLAEKSRWMWDCWWNSMDQIFASFDIKKFAPLYYCKSCRRLEDGTHRLFAAEILDIKHMSVEIGEICYKGALDIAIARFIEQAIDSLCPGKKDLAWFQACRETKWPIFEGDIKIRGRSVLDIGCHVGYTCYRAWREGATYALGIDTRADVLQVAEALKSHVGATNLEFKKADWRDYKPDNFDIVFCMGLLHYFTVDVYRDLLAKLCAACNETLVLEHRILDSKKPFLCTRSQTIPTIPWLNTALHEMGFTSIKRHAFAKNKGRIFAERGLWISKRRRNVI